MFTITVLGSGSSGNCALISTDQCHLLVDAGLSARQTVAKLDGLGIKPEQLDGILLTHEHCDHASGLEVLCRRREEIPIYCNKLTADALRHCGTLLKHRNWQFFTTGKDFEIKDIAVQTFSVPHDAVEPVGFMFHHERAALGFLTDLGYATKLVHERIRAATTLLIETNHDNNLLSADTKRPWSVKQRITSRHGHLSNEAAAGVIAQLLSAGNKLRRAVLGHLSSDCNSPELAVATIREKGAFSRPELEVFCASRKEVSARMVIEPTPPEPEVKPARVKEEAPAADPFQQMDLFGARPVESRFSV